MIRSSVLCALAAIFSLLPLSATATEALSLKHRILMPGKLISGHAEFESECTQCHVSFNQAGSTRLCLDCHDEVQADRQGGSGYHGLNPLASTSDCTTCHTDHRGRDADIINLQPDTFDHSHTRFPLTGRHAEQQCSACHQPDTKRRDTGSACVDCHEKDDFHRGALGDQCDSCHQPQGWQQRRPFDHSTTRFPLQGLHQEVACSSCHAGQVYEFGDMACVNCHKAADVHAGKNGLQCDTCHSVDGWNRTVFDHNTTRFALTHKHAEVPCSACHAGGTVQKDISTSCHSCHASDDVHHGRNGTQCESCHQNQAWAQVKFDHAARSGFPLTGAHAQQACISCHTGSLKDPLPRDCATCHAADDIHKQAEMTVCATCHVTESWSTIFRFDHDFTQFPLVGMHQIVACESCHLEGQFIGTAANCVSCHKTDDHHKGALGTQCQDCHTPNAWNLWQFDHETHTGYALLGAHTDLACDGCHKPGSNPANTTTLCGSCHGHQDIHNGGFGPNCGRCHSQNRFFELILQE